MPVFISHSSADDLAARHIQLCLASNEIKCYLDDLDDSLRSVDDIATAIEKNLERCSHLLAVVSAVTRLSWWVPFEIGVGTAKNAKIATYQLQNVDLPQYLTKWPVLSTEDHLSLYAQFCRKDEDMRLPIEKDRRAGAPTIRIGIRTADDFHRDLKDALGQG